MSQTTGQQVMVQHIPFGLAEHPLRYPITPMRSIASIPSDVYVSAGGPNSLRSASLHVYQVAIDSPAQGGGSIAKSFGFGVLGAAAGFGVGALAGLISSSARGEDEWIPVVVGGAIGAGITYPIGVHLGNDRRGSLILDYIPLVASGAIMTSQLNGNAERTAVIMGIIYLVGTVLIEQAVGNED